jgi:hypothetical protein
LRLQLQVDQALKFIASGPTAEESRIIQQRRLAQSRAIWIRMGLPKLEDHWDERSMALCDALVEVANASPTDHSEVQAKWRDAAARVPQLDVVPEVAALRYLCAVLKLPTPVAASEPEQPAARQDNDPQRQVLTFRPMLSGLPATGTDASPPFSFWLFSPEDRRLKIQLACAAGLLMAVVAVQALDGYRTVTRAHLLERLNAALASGQQIAVLDAAQSYLSAPAPLRGDPTESQVRKFYLQALKRQIAAHLGAPDPDTDRYLQRFGELSGNRT